MYPTTICFRGRSGKSGSAPASPLTGGTSSVRAAGPPPVLSPRRCRSAPPEVRWSLGRRQRGLSSSPFTTSMTSLPALRGPGAERVTAPATTLAAGRRRPRRSSAARASSVPVPRTGAAGPHPRRSDAVVSFAGSASAAVTLHRSTPFRVLLHATDASVFLLNGGDVPSGRSLSVVCVGPRPCFCLQCSVGSA